MAPKRRAMEHKQPVPPPAPPPPPPPPPSPALRAVLSNPLIVDQLFLCLPSIQDRVSLASTCKALRAHAYAPMPGGGGGGGSGGGRARLWPNIYIGEEHMDWEKWQNSDDPKRHWLTATARGGGGAAAAAASGASSPAAAGVGSQVLRLSIGTSDYPTLLQSYAIASCVNACSSLISAEISLFTYWTSEHDTWYTVVDGSEFPATLRHLKLNLGVEEGCCEEGEDPRQELDLAVGLPALTSLATSGAVVGSLPPTLRRLDCVAWAGAATSASEALLQPEALEWIRVDLDWYSYPGVWVAGGEGGGASSGEGLAKFLRHAKHVDIEALLPLDMQFFERMPPTLHTLRLPDLCNGPGLLADGLGRLADRIPGLRRVAVSPCEALPMLKEGPVPAGVGDVPDVLFVEVEGDDFAGLSDAWQWTGDDCLEAALALLAIPQLHHLDIDSLLDKVVPSELSPALCARFAALPALPALRSLTVSQYGLPVVGEVLLGAISNIEALAVTSKGYRDMNMEEVRAALAAAVPALPRLAAICVGGLDQVPEDPIKYLWGVAPGDPGWRAASPAIKAAAKRGLQIKRLRQFADEDFDLHAWDKVEMGQHGPEKPCVDLDALGEWQRGARRLQNFKPQD